MKTIEKTITTTRTIRFEGDCCESEHDEDDDVFWHCDFVVWDDIGGVPLCKHHKDGNFDRTELEIDGDGRAMRCAKCVQEEGE